MKQNGLSAVLVVLILIILGAIGYFGYKYFLPLINQAIPSYTSNPNQTTVQDHPVIVEPNTKTKLVSPLTIRGTVPPGWMFEGVFPIKLVDSNRKLIVQGTAKEEVPGSWQSNVSEYFTVTLTFATTAKTGFIVIENDNPSGDPAKAKSFEVPVTF